MADNNVPVLSRLQGRFDLRNTDKNRLTSLSWAAIEGSLEVYEWLLLDYGHDDQELSRVGRCLPSLTPSLHTHPRTRTTTRSSISSPRSLPHRPSRLTSASSAHPHSSPRAYQHGL